VATDAVAGEAVATAMATEAVATHPVVTHPVVTYPVAMTGHHRRFAYRSYRVDGATLPLGISRTLTCQPAAVSQLSERPRNRRRQGAARRIANECPPNTVVPASTWGRPQASTTSPAAGTVTGSGPRLQAITRAPRRSAIHR
jgi:hypothetical protein